MRAHLFKHYKLDLSTVPRRHRATGRASHVTYQNSNAASRDQVATLMLDLESSLPSMSCSQLASTITSVHCSYRAAVLGVEAGQSELDEVVEYYTSELPDQSWLLTFRARVTDQLPAAAPWKAASPSSSSSSSGGSSSSAGGSGSTDTTGSCNAQHLLAIMTALAGLPIQVVQPLPIGFGTPRWSRPLAAADPAAWEQWLGQVTAAYAALVDASLTQHQQQQHINLQPLLHQLAEFVISLACSMRWANVNVDDDRLQTEAFKASVLQTLQQHLHAQQRDAQQQGAQQRGPRTWGNQQDQAIESSTTTTTTTTTSNSTSTSSSTGHNDTSAQLQHTAAAVPVNLLSSDESANAQEALQQQEHDGASVVLAGSTMHRLTYSMLLLLLPPPRDVLAAFFQATADQLWDLFEIQELQAVVRGLLFLGAAPSEPWLKALVEVVRLRAAELPCKDVQGFVEGFRFFGTKLSKAAWLRDATAQLEEFTLN